MQKLILLCLLAAIPFSKSILTEETCIGKEADTCQDIGLVDTSLQCCNVKVSKFGQQFANLCMNSIYPTPKLDTFKDIIPKFDAVYKEAIGFVLYGQATKISDVMTQIDPLLDQFAPIDITLDCKDRDLSFTYDKISEADKKKLKSENNCLYYTYQSFIDPSKKLNSNCGNGVITDTIKNEGFSCGYYGFKINVQGKTTQEFNTCFLFNHEIYDQINGITNFQKLVDELNEIVELITTDQVSFDIDIHDGSGYKYSYNSLEQKFVLVSEPNRSSFVSVSKFLLLLSLLLF